MSRKICEALDCAANFSPKDPHSHCVHHAPCTVDGAFDFEACHTFKLLVMSSLLITSAAHCQEDPGFQVVRRRWSNFRKLASKSGLPPRWVNQDAAFLLGFAHAMASRGLRSLLQEDSRTDDFSGFATATQAPPTSVPPPSPSPSSAVYMSISSASSSSSVLPPSSDPLPPPSASLATFAPAPARPHQPPLQEIPSPVCRTALPPAPTHSPPMQDTSPPQRATSPAPPSTPVATVLPGMSSGSRRVMANPSSPASGLPSSSLSSSSRREGQSRDRKQRDQHGRCQRRDSTVDAPPLATEVPDQSRPLSPCPLASSSTDTKRALSPASRPPPKRLLTVVGGHLSHCRAASPVVQEDPIITLSETEDASVETPVAAEVAIAPTDASPAPVPAPSLDALSVSLTSAFLNILFPFMPHLPQAGGASVPAKAVSPPPSHSQCHRRVSSSSSSPSEGESGRASEGIAHP